VELYFPEGKRPLGNPILRWEDNVKMDLQEMGWHIDWIDILGNDQFDALFLNVFILCLYMFRAASAHHLEVQIVLIHHLV
jgi:hypothetical protein